MTLLLLLRPPQLPPVAAVSFGGVGRSTITAITTTISTMTTMTMVQIHQNIQQISGIVCLDIYGMYSQGLYQIMYKGKDSLSAG